MFLLFILFAGAVSAISISNPFYFDDHVILAANRWLTDQPPSHYWFGGFFFDAGETFFGYRPTLMLSFYLNSLIGGLSSASLRWGNLLLHLFNGILLYGIFSHLLNNKHRIWISAGAAALFLLHPIQTIALNMVWKRSSILETMFILFALLIHIKERERETYRRRTIFLLSLLFLLAVTTKESAVILLPLLVATDFLFFRSKVQTAPEKTLLTYAPLLLLTLLFIWFRLDFMHDWLREFRQLVPGIDPASRDQYRFASFGTLTRYFRLWLVPEVFIIEDPKLTALQQPFMLAMSFFFLAVSGILIGFTWKKVPLLAFALLLIWLPFVPVTLVPATLFFAMDPARLYLPPAGFSLVLLLGIEFAAAQWQKAKPSFPITSFTLCLTISLILVYGIVSATEHLRFRDPTEVWKNVTEEFPQSALAWGNLGSAYEEERNHIEAARAYRQASTLAPTRQRYRVHSLDNYLKAGADPQQIIPALNQITTFGLTEVDVIHLANLEIRLGRTDQAQQYLLQFVEEYPHHDRAHLRLGEMWESAGKHDEAQKAYRNVLILHPGDEDAERALQRLNEKALKPAGENLR